MVHFQCDGALRVFFALALAQTMGCAEGWDGPPGGDDPAPPARGQALNFADRRMIDVGRNLDGRLEVFARGTDNAIFNNWQTAPNSTWSGWASLGGALTTPATVGQNGDGRLEIFAIGMDNAVWH